MKKCDRDCFNCEYDDCVQNSITAEERAEINARNNNLRESIKPAKQRKALRVFSENEKGIVK